MVSLSAAESAPDKDLARDQDAGPARDIMPMCGRGCNRDVKSQAYFWAANERLDPLGQSFCSASGAGVRCLCAIACLWLPVCLSLLSDGCGLAQSALYSRPTATGLQYNCISCTVVPDSRPGDFTVSVQLRVGTINIRYRWVSVQLSVQLTVG